MSYFPCFSGSSKKSTKSLSAAEAQLQSLSMLSPFGGMLPGMDPGMLPYMYPGLPGLMSGVPGVPSLQPGLMPGQWPTEKWTIVIDKS